MEDDDPIVVGSKKAPVKEKPDATQTVVRKMAEAGREAAKVFLQSNEESVNQSDLGNRMVALCKEMEETDAANRKKTEEQANHDPTPAT